MSTPLTRLFLKLSTVIAVAGLIVAVLVMGTSPALSAPAAKPPTKTPSPTSTPTRTPTPSGPTPTWTPTRTPTSIPGANFVGSPLSGAAPLTVQFTHIDSTIVRSCTWTFGDGATQSYDFTPGPYPGSCPTTSHTYTAAGSYTVSLSVTKATNGNTNTNTKPNYIQVN